MVCIRNFAFATLAVSATAFFIPSLDELTEFFAPAIDQIGRLGHSDQGIKISTFQNPSPKPDEKPVPGNAPLVQCLALEPQILDLQKVIISPNLPVKGQNLTFTATGDLSEEIEDGAYMVVDVRLGYIRLIRQRFDLCEQAPNIDMECPIEKGEHVITKLVEIPSEVLPGKYTINAQAFDKSDKLITCLTATIEFPA